MIGGMAAGNMDDRPVQQQHLTALYSIIKFLQDSIKALPAVGAILQINKCSSSS